MASATLYRRLRRMLLPAVALAAAACTSYVVLPVDVNYEKVSAPYVVTFINQTGAPFEVRASESGRRTGYGNVAVAPGGKFSAILQLRQFTVGAGSSVPGVRVLEGPYFEHSPPDKAEIRFAQGEPRSLLVALRHPSWFEPYTQSAAEPIELVVPVKAFSLMPLFPRGPPGGP